MAFFRSLGISITIDRQLSGMEGRADICEAMKQESIQIFRQEVDGKAHVWEIATSVIANRYNATHLFGYVKFIREITEHVNIQKKLEHLAKTDELTTLNNRREFMESAEARVDTAGRRGERMSMLLIDIDHFKSINDTYGHLVGDEVIRKLSGIIRASVRQSDLTGRFGGEEFTVLLQGADGLQAHERAEVLREKVADTQFREEGVHGNVTVSIGVAQA